MPQELERGGREPAAVREMFNRVARRYDLANHLLSGGIDILWRRGAARMVADWQPRRVLDVATGSGDLALAIQRRLPDAEVVATDFSEAMLAHASAKGVRNTVLADALALPFGRESFDTVTVAFGLRNMADWGAALREMSRVLNIGGRILVLDFSLPTGFHRDVYRFYLHRLLPIAAGWITGQRAAYHYLSRSIEAFPSGQPMLQLIGESGCVDASAHPLSGGIATIYTARRGT